MPIVDFKTSERDQHETPFSKQGRAFSVRGAPLMPGAHGVIFSVICPLSGAKFNTCLELMLES